MNRQYLIRFLKALEAAIPPPPCAHHAITYATHFTGKDGSNEQLAVQVNVRGVFRCVIIDEYDCDKSAVDLAAEIVELIQSLK